MGDHVCQRADELHAAATGALRESGRQDPKALTALAERLEATAAELSAALRTATGPEAGRLARALVSLTRAGCDLQEDAVTRRFEAVVRIHDSLSRLREVTDVADLLVAAAEEMARCCDLDRTVVSRRQRTIKESCRLQAGQKEELIYSYPLPMAHHIGFIIRVNVFSGSPTT